MLRIASYLLNIVYGVTSLVVAPFIVWAMLRRGKYRQGWGQKLLGRLPRRTGDRRCVWLHAVSVGEVNVIRGLVEGIVAADPEIDVVITSTTNAGYALARRRFSNYTVAYCPLDFSWAVRTALDRIRPTDIFLAELELWPNLVTIASHRGVRVAIVNGRLSDSSFRGYRRIRWFIRRLLARLAVIAVQDEATAERFAALGAPRDRLFTTGSLKYDLVNTDRDNEATRSLRTVARFTPQDRIWIAGSTQHPEEEIALAAFREWMDIDPRLQLVIVPRHPERFDAVAALLDTAGLPWRRRSQLGSDSRRGPERILLVDTIGELGAWWGLAEIAFVGGSLGSRGGQNMIEPAAYGAAVSFGPNTRNFRQIVATLLEHDAAVVIHDKAQLAEFVGRCIQQPDWAKSLGARAQAAIQTRQGATDHTLELLGFAAGKEPSNPSRSPGPQSPAELGQARRVDLSRASRN